MKFLNIRGPRATYMSEFGSVSRGWNQGVRHGCSPPKAWLGLLNLLARWLTHITADKRPQFLSYWQRASVPHHMGLSKSHTLSSWHGSWLPPDQVGQERKQDRSTIFLIICLRSDIPSLWPYSIGHAEGPCKCGRALHRAWSWGAILESDNNSRNMFDV